MYAYAVYRAIVVILEFILSHGIPAGAFPQEPPAAGCASKRRLEAAFCPKARTKDISVPRTWWFFFRNWTTAAAHELCFFLCFYLWFWCVFGKIWFNVNYGLLKLGQYSLW